MATQADREYNLSLAKSLISLSNSELHKVNETRTLHLPYSCITNIGDGVARWLNLNLNLQFCVSLHGVVVAYEHVKLLTKGASILDDLPYLVVEINADYYVFRPTEGCLLRGEVNRLGDDFVGGLIHSRFNLAASCTKDGPAISSIRLGDTILIRVTQVNFHGQVLFVRGKLLSNLTKKSNQEGDDPEDDGYASAASRLDRARNSSASSAEVNVNLSEGVSSNKVLSARVPCVPAPTSVLVTSVKEPTKPLKETKDESESSDDEQELNKVETSSESGEDSSQSSEEGSSESEEESCEPVIDVVDRSKIEQDVREASRKFKKSLTSVDGESSDSDSSAKSHVPETDRKETIGVRNRSVAVSDSDGESDSDVKKKEASPSELPSFTVMKSKAKIGVSSSRLDQLRQQNKPMATSTPKFDPPGVGSDKDVATKETDSDKCSKKRKLHTDHLDESLWNSAISDSALASDKRRRRTPAAAAANVSGVSVGENSSVLPSPKTKKASKDDFVAPTVKEEKSKVKKASDSQVKSRKDKMPASDEDSHVTTKKNDKSKDEKLDVCSPKSKKLKIKVSTSDEDNSDVTTKKNGKSKDKKSDVSSPKSKKLINKVSTSDEDSSGQDSDVTTKKNGKSKDKKLEMSSPKPKKLKNKMSTIDEDSSHATPKSKAKKGQSKLSVSSAAPDSGKKSISKVANLPRATEDKPPKASQPFSSDDDDDFVDSPSTQKTSRSSHPAAKPAVKSPPKRAAAGMGNFLFNKPLGLHKLNSSKKAAEEESSESDHQEDLDDLVSSTSPPIVSDDESSAGNQNDREDAGDLSTVAAVDNDLSEAEKKRLRRNELSRLCRARKKAELLAAAEAEKKMAPGVDTLTKEPKPSQRKQPNKLEVSLSSSPIVQPTNDDSDDGSDVGSADGDKTLSETELKRLKKNEQSRVCKARKRAELAAATKDPASSPMVSPVAQKKRVDSGSTDLPSHDQDDDEELKRLVRNEKRRLAYAAAKKERMNVSHTDTESNQSLVTNYFPKTGSKEAALASVLVNAGEATGDKVAAAATSQKPEAGSSTEKKKKSKSRKKDKKKKGKHDGEKSSDKRSKKKKRKRDKESRKGEGRSELSSPDASLDEPRKKKSKKSSVLDKTLSEAEAVMAKHIRKLAKREKKEKETSVSSVKDSDVKKRRGEDRKLKRAKEEVVDSSSSKKRKL